MKTFYVWLEHTLRMRRIISNFADTLQMNKDAVEGKNFSINSIKERKLDSAIDNLGITPEAKSKLKEYAKQHPEQSLMDLLNQIQEDEIVLQDLDVSRPAKLPQGTQPAPQPFNKQQMMQQQGGLEASPLANNF